MKSDTPIFALIDADQITALKYKKWVNIKFLAASLYLKLIATMECLTVLKLLISILNDIYLI